jgi:hypothetical protein
LTHRETDPEDVTEMLNQLFTAADIAADHHRTLLAEAEEYRLARQATAEPEEKEKRPSRLPLPRLRRAVSPRPAS